MNWTELRSEFPIASHWAYFDHVAVSPIPRAGVAALTEYGERIAAGGLADIHFWVNRVQAVRTLAARLVNAPTTEDVCFIPNTTTAIGWIAEGFPWKPGDNVVLAAEEYPSNQYPWMSVAAARGIEVRRVPSRGNQIHIDDVWAAIDGRTRVLSTSFVQFASGFRANLNDLGTLAREHDLFFFVDAIQGLGAFPIDVRSTPIDALAADGHKWLLAPEGAGFAYIRREWIERLHPFGIGAHSVTDPFNYGTIDLKLQPHAGRYEGGALNLPGLSALGASLELLRELGPAAVAERILELTDYLCERAPSAGLDVFSCRDLPSAKSGIVALTKPGVDPKLLQAKCREAGVIVNVRVGRMRVSPHCWNSTDDVDRFLTVAREVRS